MKKEYFCDYFMLKGKAGDVELDNVKVIYTKGLFKPTTISVRMLLSKIPTQFKERLHEMSKHRVEVVWVPYDKEYIMDMVGDLHHIKNGEDSYSFRVTENTVPSQEEKEEDLKLLHEVLWSKE